MEARAGYQEPRRRQIAERRRRRREIERRRRRQFRRRRLTALAAIAAAVAAAVALLGGGSPAPRQAGASGGTAAASKPHKPSGQHAKLVRGYEAPVPVLMYHVIAEAPSGAANPGLFVPPEELEQQVEWLAGEGFTGVTLDRVDDAWHDDAKIPSKPIVLTFDDGTRGQHDAAGPILAAQDWPGVLNLKLESIKQGELSAEMVTDLVAAGWEIDSHTLTHRDLTTLDPDSLRHEVSGSRRAIARRFDVPVDFFCYPSGAYDEAAIAAVREAGYRGATTTKPGLAYPDDLYELARIRIEPGDGAAGLEAKLAAAGLDLD